MQLTCYKLEENPPPIVPGRLSRDWMDATSGRHAYRCLPLNMANCTGWEILCPFDFTAFWNGGQKIEDIFVRPDEPGFERQEFVKSHFAAGILTFHTGYLFQTDPGWQMLAMGPPNSPKNRIAPLSGLVETEWLPYSFTMNWKFTRPGRISFKKGEPFCFILPVRVNELEEVQPVIKPIESNPELSRQHDAWRDSRAAFNVRLAAKEPEAIKAPWQRYYFLGKRPDDPDAAPPHVNKRQLKMPVQEDMPSGRSSEE